MASTERDIHSYAKPDEAHVTHVALDLRADFEAKRLTGTAQLRIERRPDAKQVVLDTRDLSIDTVTDSAGTKLSFMLAPPDPILGRALTVFLPDGNSDIVIHYQTSPTAEALQWLEPSQTAGKKRPYLFSQGQAILTRTWIPTQDSPGIRQTYSARIVVPPDLRAVMSAEQLTPDGKAVDGGRAFEFRLTNPIPPYLIAIAVGDIAFRPNGPRTGVYAEDLVVGIAANEFADLEKMVSAAEALMGPYQWGRYDVLVLPPSFPFGGMENPRLTFATPTVLAGDRSLVSLIAHELAHSWSGNLVTNATWSDFWLNEGVTTYVESRIMEALYGRDRAAMLDVLNRTDLMGEMARLGGPSSPDTILHVDLNGRNPDDGATTVPYNKGAALLKLIEQTVGREPFDAWLKGYLDRHAFQSITTATFLADLRGHLIRRSGGREETASRRVDLSSRASRQRADAGLRCARSSRTSIKGIRRRRQGVRHYDDELDDAGVAALPGVAAEDAHACAARGSGQDVQAECARQQRSPVRLAPYGDQESLRAGHAGAGTLPHEPGPPEVPEAAVRGSDGGRLGQARRETHLHRGATPVSLGLNGHARSNR